MIIGQLVGPNSQLLSLVLVAVTALMLFLWWANENKEGLMISIIKTAAVFGILVNIFVLPTFFGMAPVNCR
jgi:hypothetical protein